MKNRVIFVDNAGDRIQKVADALVASKGNHAGWEAPFIVSDDHPEDAVFRASKKIDGEWSEIFLLVMDVDYPVGGTLAGLDTIYRSLRDFYRKRGPTHPLPWKHVFVSTIHAAPLTVNSPMPGSLTRQRVDDLAFELGIRAKGHIFPITANGKADELIAAANQLAAIGSTSRCDCLS